VSRLKYKTRRRLKGVKNNGSESKINHEKVKNKAKATRNTKICQERNREEETYKQN
jgi:hypothetical protein